MPNSARPTLTVLREQIKTESRVQGSDNLNTFIEDVVNELLLDYAQKNRYFEFLVTNSSITTLFGISSYSLPADFMNIRLVRYRQTPTGYTRSLHPRSTFADTPNGRTPRFFEITGDTIEVFPFEELPASDFLLIDYFKIPETLTAEDTFPIPRLLPSVKLEAIHRVLLYNRDLAAAAAMKGEAVENEVRSKPSDG